MNMAWLYPKPTGHPTDDRRASTIQTGFIALLITAAIVILHHLLRGFTISFPLVGGTLAIVVTLIVNYRGHWRWAAKLGAYGVLFSGALLIMQARDGYRSIVMILVPTPLLIVVMLLRTRDYIALALTTLVTVTALGVAEIHGLIPATPIVRTPTSYMTVFWVDLIVSIIAVFGGLLARDARLNVADLRESEEKYRSLFDSSCEAVLLTGPDGKVFSANPEACRIFGRSELEICRLGRDYLVDTSDPRLRGALDERARTGKVRAELTFLRADGTRFPGEISSAAFIDREGRPRASMSIRDITDRKRAEQQLTESNERFVKAFRSAPVLVAITTLSDGTYVDINDYALRIAGFTRDEVIGKTATGISWITKEERDRLLDTVNRYGRIAGLEVSFSTKSGRKLTGEVYGEKIVLNGAECLLSVTVDITERRQAQAEREKLLAQLAQARKMESIGRLAGGVAHDFNNILTVINGYAGFLVSALPAHDERREHAVEIRTAGDRAAALTRDLLAFSRKQVTAPRAFALNDSIAHAKRLLQRLIGDDIEMCSNLSTETGMVMADPNQLEQVIVNLAVNARDAMPHGGRLEISTANADLDDAGCTHPDAMPGHYVLMTVSDSGTGMTPEVVSNLFEPFFTTKEPGKGTGLGLATAYGIVRQHKGWIDVQTELGKGTSFKVYLPQVEATEAAELAAPTATRTHEGRGTVLVVEDQPEVRRLARKILEFCGYGVLEAASAAEAHAIVRQHTGRIDLLLTDVVMPGTDGQTLSKELRQLLPDLPVILMSGYSEDLVAQRGVIPHGATYIQKPFTPDGLAAMVRGALGQSPGEL